MFPFPFFLIWGSFLNVLGVRLVENRPLTGRSECQSCHKIIYWYDNFPIISFILLRGKCRHCKSSISILYPIIELLTALLFSFLYSKKPLNYFLGYSFFFSCLLVALRSDFDTMLIHRATTLYAIPIIWILISTGYLPISLKESLVGAFSAFLFLTTIRWLFKLSTGKEGMGQGDVDLLCLIGATTGVIGWWISLFIGCFLGIAYALLHTFIYNKTVKNFIMPFGPFLAIGSFLFVLLQNPFIQLCYPLFSTLCY